MTDLRKLQDAMNRGDVAGISRELFRLERCQFCETLTRLVRCTAPGCTAQGCAECVNVHMALHLYSETDTQ
jgi:hypothetical protein